MRNSKWYEIAFSIVFCLWKAAFHIIALWTIAIYNFRLYLFLLVGILIHQAISGVYVLWDAKHSKRLFQKRCSCTD